MTDAAAAMMRTLMARRGGRLHPPAGAAAAAWASSTRRISTPGGLSRISLKARIQSPVSSPGPQRPLTKPQHFRRFLGRRARVRTREEHDGHRSFTGELVGASDDDHGGRGRPVRMVESAHR